VTTKNQNFEKVTRSQSNNKKNEHLIKRKEKLVLRLLGQRGNFRKSKYWQTSKENNQIFFEQCLRFFSKVLI
jgi:hypothetical protein